MLKYSCDISEYDQTTESVFLFLIKTHALFQHSLMFGRKTCVAAIGAMRFLCVSSACALFYFLEEL